MCLAKTFKVLILLILCGATCSCSYNAATGDNSLHRAIDSFGLRMGLTKPDPGKRSPIIHRAIYDFYKRYELVYFYLDNGPVSKKFEQDIKKYAFDSWIKLSTCSINKKELPYTKEQFSSLYRSGSDPYLFFSTLYKKNLLKTPTLVLLLRGPYPEVFPITKEVISYEELVDKINSIAAEHWLTLSKIGDFSLDVK